MSPPDRQLSRWAEARAHHHAATMAHRDATAALEQASAELVTAGAALGERVRLLDVTHRADERRAA